MYSLIDPAALKIAVDMVDDGLIEKDHAVKNLVEPGHLEQLFHPQFASDVDYKQDVMGEGLPVSPGAAVGRAVFTADDGKPGTRTARTSSWSASRRAPRTWAAWTRRRAFSPPAGG